MREERKSRDPADDVSPLGMVGGPLLILRPGKLSAAHRAWLGAAVLELRGGSRERLNAIVREGVTTGMISSGSPRSSSEGVMGDGAGGARYALGMAGKAGVPEDFIPIKDPERIAAMNAELAAMFKADRAKPLALILRDLAREMLAASKRLAEGRFANLEAARRTIEALERDWRGHRRNPQEHAIREVVRGADSLLTAYFLRRERAPREVGPRAISWRHVRERVPKDLRRALRPARGWARVDLLSTLPAETRHRVLIEAIAVRRLEELRLRFPSIVFRDDVGDLMLRAIHSFVAGRGSRHGKFDSLFKLFEACGIPSPPTKAALKQAIARARR